MKFKDRVCKVFNHLCIKTSVSCFLLFISNFVCGQSLTLQQVINQTLKNNIQIKQAFLKVQISEVNLKQSKFNLLPDIVENTQTSQNLGRTLDVSTYNFINQRVSLFSSSLTSQLILYQGGQLREQILLNKNLLDIDKNNFAKIEHDLTIDVIFDFLRIITNKALLNASQKQLSFCRSTLNNIDKQFKYGLKSASDVAQILTQESAIESDIINVQNSIYNDEVSLKYLMQIPDSSKINLLLPKTDSSISVIDTNNFKSVINRSIIKDPDLRIAKIQIDVTNQNIKILKDNFYPTASLFASLGSNFSDARSLTVGSKFVGLDTVGIVSNTNQKVLAPAFDPILKRYSFKKQLTDNFYQTIGINIRIPLFSRFSNKTALINANLVAKDAALKYDLVKENLTKIIRQSTIELITSFKQVEVAKMNFSAQKKILFSATKRFEAGLITMLDYNIIIGNYNKSELNLIQQQYSLLFRKLIIKFYEGEDIDTITF